MNVLLFMPPEPAFSPFWTSEKRIPVGLAFLEQVLRQAGHGIWVVDGYLDPNAPWRTPLPPPESIDLVGIQANTICLDGVMRIAATWQYLRERGRFRGRIALGGPATATLSDYPDWIDHVVIGEGEAAVMELAAGSAERVIRRPWPGELDELPLPRFESFLRLPYDWSSPWLPGRRVVNLNTSRGCPFGCTFCSVGSIWGRQYRAMSAGRVWEWVRQLQAAGFDGVYFREDNFTLRRDRTEAFCRAMLGTGVEWICETRIDTLDEETVALMADAGCRAVYVGVEAGSDRVLGLLKKGETTDQFRRAFGWFRRHGIRAYASFIVGLPGTTESDDLDSLRFADELGADHRYFNVFVGVPVSPLYRQIEEFGLFEFKDYRGLLYLRGHNRRVLRWYGPGTLLKMGLHLPSRLYSALQQRLGWSVAGRRAFEPLACTRADAGRLLGNSMAWLKGRIVR